MTCLLDYAVFLQGEIWMRSLSVTIRIRLFVFSGFAQLKYKKIGNFVKGKYLFFSITFQLKVLLSATGNAHSPPSSTSFRKTTIVRYLEKLKSLSLLNSEIRIILRLWKVEGMENLFSVPAKPAILRAIQTARFVIRDFFAVMVTVIMTAFCVMDDLWKKTRGRYVRITDFWWYLWRDWHGDKCRAVQRFTKKVKVNKKG